MVSGDNHNQADRWKCCPCCAPGRIGWQDHKGNGGWIEKDGHDGPCPDHQPNYRSGEVPS